MSEPPSRDGRPARSDSASRLAALLADVVERPDPVPAGTDTAPTERAAEPRRVAAAPVPPAAPSDDGTDPDRTADLAQLIAGSRVAPAPPAPDARRPVPPAEPTASIPGPPAAPSHDADDVIPTADIPAPARPRAAATLVEERPPPARPAPAPAPASAPAPGEADAAPPPPRRVDADDDPPRRGRRITLRAVAFGVAFAVLVAAVPALGYVGKERLLHSKAGTVVEGTRDATEAGYLAGVTPTATALVIHRDADQQPTSATVLSLGGGDDGGGTVLLIPLTLQRSDPGYYSRIIDGYDVDGDDDGFRRRIEDVLEVQVPPPIIDVTDENLETLVAPVAPLSVMVTDPVVLEDGTALSGPVELTAEQVGPFLRATREGEPEVAQLERARDLWTAWLTAIGESTATEPIGAAATGIGTYLRTLAAAPPQVETLDVEQGVTEGMEPPFLVPSPNMDEQVIDAVPFPLSPRVGTRFNMEVRNGAEGAPLPMPLLHDLILGGGALIFLGNATELGQEGSLVEYNGDQWREAAEEVAAMLGPSAEVAEIPARRAQSENEDLVITIGSEALAAYEEQDGG